MTPEQRKETARLYPHAYDAGFEEAQERVTAHLRLSQVAGDNDLGRRAIQSLASVESYLPEYLRAARAAGRAGEFAVACSEVLEPLGISMPDGANQLIAAHISAEIRERRTQRSDADDADLDPVDRCAAAFERLHAAPRRHSPKPETEAPQLDETEDQGPIDPVDAAALAFVQHAG